MRNIVIASLAVSAVLLSGAAMADNRHHRGYDSRYDRGYERRYDRGYWSSARRHDNRQRGHSRSHGPTRHEGRYRSYYGGSYWNLSVGGRHHDHFSTGSFLGGLVLGGVLGSVHDSHAYRRTAEPAAITVVRRSPTSAVHSGTQRRLLRDLAGRCYAIHRDGFGGEVRTEIAPAACNF